MNIISIIDRISSNLFPCSDLMWDLHGTRDKQAATRFLKSLEGSLCLLASSVKQLYSNYRIESASHPDHLMVLPTPYTHHDTFNHVVKAAMLPTSYFIIPGTVVDKAESELFLAWRKSDGEGFSHMPLWKGLERLMMKALPGKPFLPVICTRDLHYLSKNKPILRLCRLDTEKLDHLSSLQINDIVNTIEAKVFVRMNAA